jgi:copper homeostasis protein
LTVTPITETRTAPAAVAGTPLLEVCVDRLGDALAAVDAGANRLEVCSALELGGLTPSTGLIKQIAAETDVEIVALNRPRAGGFCFDRHDLATAYREAEESLAAGADGVVCGFLHENGTIDGQATARMVELAGQSRCVFHRAFDFTPEMVVALEQLIDLGVRRVLTSGGMPTAEAGAARLRELTEQAGTRIEVLPGGGIRADNVVMIVRAVGCRQVHIGGSTVGRDTSLAHRPALELRTTSDYAAGDFRSVHFESVNRIASLLRDTASCEQPSEPQSRGG